MENISNNVGIHYKNTPETNQIDDKSPENNSDAGKRPGINQSPDNTLENKQDADDVPRNNQVANNTPINSRADDSLARTNPGVKNDAGIITGTSQVTGNLPESYQDDGSVLETNLVDDNTPGSILDDSSAPEMKQVPNSKPESNNDADSSPATNQKVDSFSERNQNAGTTPGNQLADNKLNDKENPGSKLEINQIAHNLPESNQNADSAPEINQVANNEPESNPDSDSAHDMNQIADNEPESSQDARNLTVADNFPESNQDSASAHENNQLTDNNLQNNQDVSSESGTNKVVNTTPKNIQEVRSESVINQITNTTPKNNQEVRIESETNQVTNKKPESNQDVFSRSVTNQVVNDTSESTHNASNESDTNHISNNKLENNKDVGGEHETNQIYINTAIIHQDASCILETNKRATTVLETDQKAGNIQKAKPETPVIHQNHETAIHLTEQIPVNQAIANILETNQIADNITKNMMSPKASKKEDNIPENVTNNDKIEKSETEINADIEKYSDRIGVNDAINGRCSFKELPPLPKKVVRIFISSTFTDTQTERNALMQHVYPRLSEYCREKHGLEFQIVDMRWGVPEQASDNHSTTQICLNEIKKCQQVSVGPYFVALVGDKYGYRPIPSEISQKLFISLEESLNMEVLQVNDWTVVKDWYILDSNSEPPEYVLQPISSRLIHYNNKENAELRKQSQNEWNIINQKLTSCLRRAAVAAFEKSKITEKEKDIFFISVTENEISEGIYQKNEPASEACFCIIRKIEDLDKFVNDPKAPRFTDLNENKSFDLEAKTMLDNLQSKKLTSCVPPTSLLKVDIEWLSSGATMNIEKVQYAEPPRENIDDNLKKHIEYVNKICTHFFDTIQKMIDEGYQKELHLYDDLTLEILQHWHFAKTRSEIFEGRFSELERMHMFLNNQDNTNLPLIVHGSSGCGKTSVIAKVLENISSNEWETSYHCIPRFLGTTPNTSNLHQLLVSLCKQISIILSISWKEPDSFKELVDSFHQLINSATPCKKLFIILDSVDQLMPTYNAFKLKWLPTTINNNAKIIVSTIDGGYPIYEAFKERFKNQSFVDIEISPLGEELGMKVIKKWLSNNNRKVTEQQEVIIKDLLVQCSLPLFTRIAFDQIRKWRSYDNTQPGELEPTVRAAINQLFESIEQKLGHIVVKHSLSYMTASRFGLSEPELEHIMSLDDHLLNEVFKHWIPPVRRIPPLLWTRVRNEVYNYIVERSADGVLVINWYHRQFIEATKAKYLSDEKFSEYIHDILVQFFTGIWGGGKDKPFEYSEFQIKRFALNQIQSSENRKVPTQPYYIESYEDEKRKLWINQRKLSEFSFHLIKCKKLESLKENIFFKFDWIFAKLKSHGIQECLEEYEIFMQASKLLKKDVEMKILYANMQLMKPYLILYPESLPYELTGRLSGFIGKSRYITNLIKESDQASLSICPIMPIMTCFSTADLSLNHNITFRTSDSWVEGGATCCTSDFQNMYIMTYDFEGKPILIHYDTNNGDQINAIQVLKPDDGTINMYTKIILSHSEKEILGFYMQKSEGNIAKKFRDKYALLDVIEIDTGCVLKTYEDMAVHRCFINPLLYMTENILCVDLINKMPIIRYKDDIKKDLDTATLLSENEEYFIVSARDKTNLRQFKNKRHLGEFDVSEQQAAIAGNGDFSLVVMTETKNYSIRLYDISNKINRTLDSELTTTNQIFKSKAHIPVNDEKIKTLLDNLFNKNTEEKVIGNRQRAVITLSPSKDSFVVIFGSWNWIAFLYTLNVSTWSVKFIGQITANIMSIDDRYPCYSYDGQCLIIVQTNDVIILESGTGNIRHKFHMAERIIDIAISKSNNKFAVMMEKNVMLLDIPENEDQEEYIDIHKDGRKPERLSKFQQSILARSNNGTLKTEKIKNFVKENQNKEKIVLLSQNQRQDTWEPEIILKDTMNKLVLEEINPLASYANTDRIASARSKEKHALQKFHTPDGLRAIHFHCKVQIVDTSSDRIIYTPRKGDFVSRSTSLEGMPVNEVINIPGLDKIEVRVVEINLKEGDKIMNNDKVKMRIPEAKEGQYKILNVPSVLTVYTVADLKLKKQQSITVFKESIISVSKRFIVTSKETSLGQFFNIYSQDEGKLIATHQLKYKCQSAVFSTDESQLFVVDASLCINGYQAPLFNSLEIKVKVHSSNGQEYTFNKLYMLNNQTGMAIYYSCKDIAQNDHRYIYIDLITKTVYTELVLPHSLLDISENGNYAVDNQLNIYNFKTSKRIIVLKYNEPGQEQLEKEHNTLLTTRFCGEKNILIHNCSIGTFHLLNVQSGQHIFSCFSHLSNNISQIRISIRNFGQKLLINDCGLITCFVISTSNQMDNRLLIYNDEKTRALSMIINEADLEQTKLYEDIFSKRDILLEQMKKEDDQAEKPVVKEFQKINPEKPHVLVVAESILSTYFVPNQFSKFLKTEKLSVQNADAALRKIQMSPKYDVIILQLITDDVVHNDAETCFQKVSETIKASQEKARIIILGLAPFSNSSPEVNNKLNEVNTKLSEKYTAVKDVHIVNNANLCHNGRPLERYFQDGVCLSAAGVKQILINYKDVLLPILAEHYWVGQKHNPSIQSSNNRIV